MSTVDQHFTVSEEHAEYSYSVGNGFLRMREHGQPGDTHWIGEFFDPRGIVSVYRQDGLTRIDFVSGGQMVSRSWKRSFGDRTIARLCRAFITDLETSDDA